MMMTTMTLITAKSMKGNRDDSHDNDGYYDDDLSHMPVRSV